MIKPEDIYAVTNDGKDIILSYYPQATETKKFSIRDERTPSCTLKKYNNVWRVTDFGDDQKARDPINVCMIEEHCTFREAILKLADRYGIVNSLKSTINKPDKKQEDAPDGIPDGHFDYELNDNFTDAELKILGVNVTPEHCKQLNFHSVKWYSRTSKRKTTIISSNENYPIFMRKCGDFMKIIQPLNPDKAFRFSYAGTKAPDYINGLDELKQAYAQFIAEQEKLDDYDDDGKRRKKLDKLPEVIICSGERDALNVASFGYRPIWFNSESYDLKQSQYNEIKGMVERIYNVPDIDTTGIKKGVELSLKYLEIYTVQLPAKLSTYKDNRGNPRKDLRDYVEIYQKKSNFDTLINTACCCKYWEHIYDDKGKLQLRVNSLFLLHFLKQNGFGKIIHPETKESIFVKVTGYIVEQILPKQIRGFILKDLNERNEKPEIKNLVLNSKRTNAGMMEDLDEIQLNFKAHTIDGQYLFFDNKALYITANEIKELRGKDSGVSVWNTNVNPHNFTRIDPAISLDEDFNATIQHTKSHFFRYLINASRIFWREEFEYRASSSTPEENETYRNNHKFDIAGTRLTQEEIKEQRLHLYNKIYAIGYLMHRYKTPELALAVWAMESKLTASDESSGGSGKSFMFNFLRNFKRSVTLNGRNEKLTRYDFFLDRVDQYTDLINIDDVHQYLPIDPFYAGITGDMPIVRKNLPTLELKYEDAPKMYFSSNFPPRNVDPSTLRRLLIIVFSDYYHKQTSGNDYLETRKISDDFGYALYNEQYKPEHWNEDFNFIVDCLQFYLTLSANKIILEAPMDKVNKRINIGIMGEDFAEWATAYFSQEGENIDNFVQKPIAFEDFKQATKLAWTLKKFTKALKSFCENEDYIQCFNPQEIAGKNGRIIKRVGNRTPDFIYIKTHGTPIREYVEQ